MTQKSENQEAEAGKRRYTRAASRSLPDGALAEMVYDPDRRATAFALWRGDRWTLEPNLILATGERLDPYSPENNIIQNDVVLLPSAPAEFGTKDDLLADIARYLHRYLDVDPDFEAIATHYALFTWVYDAFNEVPYVRFQGDYGTGKTRGLLALGSICYKPFFASGASSVSPLFHIMEMFRGTLILDEADFRFSDEKSELVKVLNNGTVKGMPLLRTMMNRQHEFNPQAFHVFGPKVIAMRHSYEDRALESRFLTQVMGTRPLRGDVPINLSDELTEEARLLRNKLLLFRFRTLAHVQADPGAALAAAPRTNQILIPLLSVVDDPDARRAIARFATRAQDDLTADRGFSTEAQILEIIRDLAGESDRLTVGLSDIAERFRTRFGEQCDRPPTPRWIGSIIRQRLHLPSFKSNGRFMLSIVDRARLEQLYARYGLAEQVPPSPLPGQLEI